MSLTRLLIRSCVLAMMLVVTLSTPPASAQAQAAIYNFDIPAQSLANALEAFGRTCNQQLVFDKVILRDKQSNALVGHYSAEEGITRLLEGSGLTYKRTAKGVLAIQASETPNTSASPHSVYSDENAQISEIIVTAQKKSERLQDVPVPVSVINADALADSGQLLLRDYYNTVPSLSYAAAIGNFSNLSIRGLSSNGGNPTVGITVDDVPFGGATSITAGGVIPDFDPGDLDHIEVLRGPQGTLYGADSMGGLMKFVTKEPSTSGYSGRVEAGASSVYSGAEPGYSFRASGNVPLGDSLAMRVSGFARRDPGYIDNPVLQLKGLNEAKAYGARWSALWQLSDAVSLRLSALYNSITADGLSDVDVQSGLGDLQQSYVRGLGGYDNKVQAYSAILKAKLGGIELTSLSGYNAVRIDNADDFTSIWGSLAQAAFPGSPGVTGAPYHSVNANVGKFSQEIRLSAPIGQQLEWVLGAIYTHERSAGEHDRVDATTTMGQVVGQYYGFTYTAASEDYAAFTDLTYHVTDRFDIQIGGRESHSRVTEPEQITTGHATCDFYGLPPPCLPYIAPPERAQGDVFTYLLTPRFKVSPDLMVYARLASGYRPGLPNGPGLGVPPASNPDKTQNYEIGVKGDFLDKTLSLDASLYYIDWKNIQLLLLTPQFFGYLANGSAAKSEGVELSVQARPLTGLTISAWVVYDDAVLTQALPANSTTYGVSGDRLPQASRFSGNLSLQQDFPVGNRMTGFLGGMVSYVGDNLGGFTGSPGVPAPRQIYPAYTKTDLRAGVKYDSWTANVYVNNVSDARGLIGGGIGFIPSNGYLYITPRTIGLNVVRSF